MARFKEKIEAIKLRKRGKSIGEIAQQVGVSKSIVSLWCRDIALTKIQIDALHEKMMDGSYKGRMTYLEKIRSKRKEDSLKLLQEGIRNVGKITDRDLFIAGAALYWAEGTKSVNKEQAAFSNSSPKMILFILKWFEQIFGVARNRFAIQIRINKLHAARIHKVEEYWQKITGLPKQQFTKTILINSIAKKVYSNSDHYGTVRVSVKGGTQIVRKIIGFIEGLSRAV